MRKEGHCAWKTLMVDYDGGCGVFVRIGGIAHGVFSDSDIVSGRR